MIRTLVDGEFLRFCAFNSGIVCAILGVLLENQAAVWIGAIVFTLACSWLAWVCYGPEHRR